MRYTGPLSALLSAAACLVIAACGGQPPQGGLAERLGEAIRNVGFACDGNVSSQALNETGDVWRVDCGAAAVYSASREPSGEVCIEPVAFVDAPVRSPSERNRQAVVEPRRLDRQEGPPQAPTQPTGQRCTTAVTI